MIQFNLLPDVKLEYVKAQRTKRTTMLAAFSITALFVFITVLLFMIVFVFQKNHIKHLNDDIKGKTTELKSIEDLDKVLTIQNQLNKLSTLHEDKPAASRLATYLVQLTPSDAKISEVEVNFDDGTMTLSGTAGSLGSINKFADILKFTDYKENNTTNKAFSEVVLSSFGVVKTGPSAGAGRSAYALKFSFDPIIFNNTKSIELVVPNIISTRSVTEKPTDLFEAKANTAQQSERQ